MMTFRERLSLAWRIIRAKRSGLVDYAEREFTLVNRQEPMDDYPDRFDDFQKHIRELLLVFSTYGHSGGSAPFGIATFCRLAKFKPLTPLTGHESEWMDCGDSGSPGMFQNRRYGAVFRINGKLLDTDAILFRDPDGLTFARPGTSDVEIEFPYEVPDQPRIIEVDDSGAPLPRMVRVSDELLVDIEQALPLHGAGETLRGAIAAALAK